MSAPTKRTYEISRDLHYVRYDRWGNDTEYPDGYEISGKWQVREVLSNGDSVFSDCCLTLTEAKRGLENDTVVIDRTHN
jgi:hypothetical protein